MSALAFTAANIRALTSQGAVTRPGSAGATVTIGQAVYRHTDGTYKPSDSDASKAASEAIGIAVESYDGETTIASGSAMTVCVWGPVAGFTSLTPNALGWVSDTAGSIDTAAGTFDRILGYAESATVFFVNPDINDPSSA